MEKTMFLLNKLSVFLFLVAFVFEFTENEFFQIKFSVVFYKFQNNFKFFPRFKETEKLLSKSVIENYWSWDLGFTVNYVGTCTMQAHKV